MTGRKVFVSTSTFAKHSSQPLKMLEEKGYCVQLNNTGNKLDTTEYLQSLQFAEGIIAGTERYTGEVIEKLSNLKVISRLGVGMENIDLNAASQKDIKIYKTQTTPAPAVAELVLGLMIDVARRISNSSHALKAGLWKKEMGCLLRGNTLGIIGLGTIGKNLVKLVKEFNFKILAFDLFHDDQFAKIHDVNYCDIDTLLTQSDIVSIHLNLSDETNKLMNKVRINKMKSESILINTSRGEIIDETALYDALKSGKIYGAGLDVFSQEPYSGPLTSLDNVVLTPHIGSYAKEIRMQMEIESVENLIRGLNEK